MLAYTFSYWMTPNGDFLPSASDRQIHDMYIRGPIKSKSKVSAYKATIWRRCQAFARLFMCTMEGENWGDLEGVPFAAPMQRVTKCTKRLADGK